MFYGGIVTPQPPTSSINLQATLSAASAGGEPCFPHHPVTCSGALSIHGDGALECEHARTEARDIRTQACVDSSIAILLFELAHERFGTTPRS